MLIIRRRAGESLHIGEDIEIDFLEVASGHVKIGIRAPREITILRHEIELTRAQNEAASSSAITPELIGLIKTFCD